MKLNQNCLRLNAVVSTEQQSDNTDRNKLKNHSGCSGKIVIIPKPAFFNQYMYDNAFSFL